MRSDENAARETARGEHSVELSGHKLFAVTGVRSVTSFTDKQVEIELDGERLLLTGHDLAVKGLDLESGRLTATGNVLTLRYSSALGVVTNTAFVLGMIWLVYGGREVGSAYVSPEFVMGMVSLNFVIEVIVFPLLSPPVAYAVRKQGCAYLPARTRLGAEAYVRVPRGEERED